MGMYIYKYVYIYMDRTVTIFLTVVYYVGIELYVT